MPQGSRVTLARVEAMKHEWPYPGCEREHGERRLNVSDVGSETWQKPPPHLRIRIERVREGRRTGHVACCVKARPSVVIGGPQLGRLQRLRRRSHREDVGRREHLLQCRQHVRQYHAQVQRLAHRNTRLRSLRDASASGFGGTALVVLEEAVASKTIRVEPHLEAPSEAQVHELRMLGLNKTKTNRLPHRRDEGRVLDVHAG